MKLTQKVDHFTVFKSLPSTSCCSQKFPPNDLEKISWLDICQYGIGLISPIMLQLSSKVMFACVPDASCTRFRCILHKFQTCPASGKKWHGTHVRLAAALSRGFALHGLSHAHSGCVSHMFRMCLRCVLDVCGYYLGAELYCILSYLLNCYVT